MGWLLALALLMAGATLGVIVASLLVMAKESDKAMADLWDDDEEDA